jgi:cell division protein FtsQ
MSSAVVRRGKTNGVKARKKTMRKQVRQISWFDRLLQSLPFTQADVQRFLTWLILAVLLVAMLLVANWFGLPKAAYKEFGGLTAKAGFEVKDIKIVGTNRVDQMKVYDIILEHSADPILLVDIDAIRNDLNKYGWIKEARVSRQLPNRLFVEITERKPVAVWQNEGKYSLLDDEGKVLTKISAAEIGNMPIVTGPNANLQLVSLSALLDKAQSLKPQIASASWVGNRRWDLRFRNGKTVSLPEGDDFAAQALVNFTRMDGIHRLLQRNIIHFDLRDPDRMYMREAPKEKTEESKPSESKPTPSKKGASGAEGSA